MIQVGKGTDLGLGSSQPVTVTVATATLTNLCTSLPNNDYQYALVSCSSGTIYVNGSVATPTLGMKLTDSMPPIMIPLPVLPKDRGVIYLVAPAANTSQAKIIGYKVRQQ
jgi:hypothetical protein